MNKLFDFSKIFSPENLATMALGAAGSAASTIGEAIGGDYSSKGGNFFNTIGNTLEGVPIVGDILKAPFSLIGGGINRLTGSKLNTNKINEIKSNINALNNLRVTATNTDDFINEYNNTDFGSDFSKSDIGSEGLFSNKVSGLYKTLKPQREYALARAGATYGNTAYNIDTQTGLNLLGQSFAQGGPIEMRTNAPMSPFGNRFSFGGNINSLYDNSIMNRVRALDTEYPQSHSPLMTLYTNHMDRLPLLFYHSNIQKDGGPIHIKKANRGKFTEAANRADMGVQEYAAHILANKERYSPTLVKRANFARNAAKWHAEGGPLFTHGAEFSNGLTFIGNGGTHEENPFEGVPMGVDQQGKPNLVEGGEFIWNDYVFSDRLKVPKAVRNMYKLRGTKDLTFADAVKQLQKESEERPNDPISKRGLEDSLNKLRMYQESERVRKENNKYAYGGKMGNIFSGEGDDENMLNYGDALLSPITPAMFDTMMENGVVITDIKEEGSEKEKIKDIKDKTKQYYDAHPKETSNKSKYKNSPLRYASALGPALGLGLTLANKPDYSRMNTIMEEASKIRRYPRTKAHTISNYLTYKPFDTEYYAAQNKAQQAAALRALENTSGGNRANAQAGILAANYAGQLALGDIYRKAEEYNQAQREKIEGFNRGTNQFNAQQLQSADAQNQSAFLNAMNAAANLDTKALAGMDAIDAARSASIAGNLSGIFENLGDIGREYNTRQMVINNPFLMYTPEGEYKVPTTREKKNGGYLTIKNKRRK